MSDRPNASIEPRPGALIAKMAQVTKMAMLDAGHADDEEVRKLVVRAAGGDPDAFREIVLCYDRRVLTLARRLLGNPDDAEEAAQEAFLRAWRFMHRVDASRGLEPWLVRLTVNVCRTFASRRGRHESRSVELTENDGRSETAASPEAGIEADERRATLWSALDALAPRERAALVLRDLEGYSTSEAAAILRTSESTVRSQISRARLRLRKALQRLEDGAAS